MLQICKESGRDLARETRKGKAKLRSTSAKSPPAISLAPCSPLPRLTPTCFQPVFPLLLSQLTVSLSRVGNNEP
ncbi:unnamed protein product [Closterium sp. Naga37s-1]|nr:unnamed protein product [Closterium sp. Naga37s-1]